jgi:tripartite-type tricarboxylate transporter receptor subunit TctC
MRTFNRISLVIFAAACVAALPVAHAAYPDKPIHLIVPFPPGGPADNIGRAVGAKLAVALGQPVVVENRPGADGGIGSAAVAKAAPDGYTLLVNTAASQTINPAIYKRLTYDPVKDLAPITVLATHSYVLVVNPKLPVKNIKELIDLAKKKPGEVTFGSAGNGSLNQLSGELLAGMAGVRMLHVPYKGSAPALVGVMSGDISFMFDALSSSLPQIKAGTVRAIAWGGPTRSPLLPDVPTIAESGVPGYKVIAWFGLLAPAGTSREIVSRLNKEATRILGLPELKAMLTGIDPAPSTPEQFAELIKTDTATWAKVIKDFGVHVD